MPGWISVTPVGVYCSACPGKKIALNEKSLRAHRMEKHPDAAVKSGPVLVEKIKRYQDEIRKGNDESSEFPVEFFFDGTLSVGTNYNFCFQCFTPLCNKSSVLRHMKSVGCPSDNIERNVACFKTKCGGWLPRKAKAVQTFLTDGNATTNKTDVEELNVLSESQPSLPATLDESFANVSTLTSDTHATRGTVSLLSVPPQGLKQRAYLRPPDRQLLPLLSPFVESQADAAGLVDLFRMLLDDNFATNLQVWVSLAMSPLQDDEVCLGWLLEVSNCWICEHAAKEVNELPPPARSKLVLVNQNDGDDDHGGQRVNTFTLRRESLKLKAVLHSFLKMWWRFPTTAFDALKAKIETYYKRPDRALSVTTLCSVVQDFLESSVIGALFRPIHQGNPEILPNKMGLGLLFSMVVLFRVKGDGTVAMYEAGWAATRLSDFLHMMELSWSLTLRRSVPRRKWPGVSSMGWLFLLSLV